MARSAKNRWWFTSSTSDWPASARARVTKQSSNRSHSRPAQVSVVADRSFQVWNWSGRSISLRSPVSVVRDHASMRGQSAASSRAAKVGARANSAPRARQK